MADGKTPVVLLHGQPGDRSDWARVLPHLPPHFEPIVPDRPGYGENPASAGTLEDNAHWLIAHLDHSGIDDAVLVGHSYGGGVAIVTAVLAPARVRALVLPAGVGPGCVRVWDRLLAAPLAGPVLAGAAWVSRRGPRGSTATVCAAAVATAAAPTAVRLTCGRPGTRWRRSGIGTATSGAAS
jgi:pimeloyl-ACP methyl ester carboxylesterase